MIPSYVINLDASPDRMTHADAVLRQVGLTPERVSGVDGRALGPEALAAYDDDHALRYMGRSMTLGEIGCYLSHVRALETFVASEAEMGIVFEDDVDLADDPSGRLPAILSFLENRQDWHAVNLGAEGAKITSAFGAVGAETVLRAHYFPMLAHAMVWRRAGAQAYLAQAAEIFCPADNMMRFVLTRSDMGLAVLPRLFSSGAFDSDIAARSGGNRSKQGRSVFYGLRKQKRLMGEKAIAMRHKRRRIDAARG